MTYRCQSRVVIMQDANGRVPVNDAKTLGLHTSAYLHRSDSQCIPQQDFATFRSSNGNVTGTFASNLCNVNQVPSSDVHSGMVSSVRNVIQHQLPSAGLSMSGGVVYDAYPLLATALTPLPAFNHFSPSHSEMPVSTVEVSKQPETNHSTASLTMVHDSGPLLAQVPNLIQAKAKQSASATFSAFDVYEFRDEDDCKPVGVNATFDQGMPSRSTANNTLDSLKHHSTDSRLPCVGDLTGKHHSETDAGLMPAQQNVAVIFDMDSKSIRHVSLPVKTEPGLNESHSDSIPLKTIDSTSMHVTWPTSYMPIQNDARHVGYGKHSLLTNDMANKRVRLYSNAGSFPALANVGTNSSLSDIPELIVRKMNKFDGRAMAFDGVHEKPVLLQHADFAGDPESSSSAFINVTSPAQKVSIKLEDVCTTSHVSNTSCSEMVKCKSESSGGIPSYQFPAAPPSTSNPQMCRVNRMPAAAVGNMYGVRASTPVSSSGQFMYMKYAGSNYVRYGIPVQKNVPVKPQPVISMRQNSKCESSWWHVDKPDHSNAVQSNYVEQSTFGDVSFEGRKQYITAGENVHCNALSHVLDLSYNSSQVSPSPSVVTGNNSFYPNLPPTAAVSRNSASVVQQTAADSHLPHVSLEHHSHSQQQQQQQLALSVIKEEVIENIKTMTDDEEKLMNRLKCDLIEEAPHCQCRGLLHTVQKIVRRILLFVLFHSYPSTLHKFGKYFEFPLLSSTYIAT